jgi:hypothetical protein
MEKYMMPAVVLVGILMVAHMWRYEYVEVGVVLDRWTGTVQVCTVGPYECVQVFPLPDAPSLIYSAGGYRRIRE